MHESMTMAEVGSIVKVSGSRIATPLGPPRPGSTPTKMPSTRPTIIRARIFQVSRTLKPQTRSPKASIVLASEEGFERALGHDHAEGDLEGDEHDERHQERGEQRFPDRDASDEHDQ